MRSCMAGIACVALGFIAGFGVARGGFDAIGADLLSGCVGIRPCSPPDEPGAARRWGYDDIGDPGACPTALPIPSTVVFHGSPMAGLVVVNCRNAVRSPRALGVNPTVIVQLADGAMGPRHVPASNSARF